MILYSYCFCYKGNGTNQAVAFDNKICDYVNHILRVGIYKDCTEEQVIYYKSRVKSGKFRQAASFGQEASLFHILIIGI